MRFWQPKTNYFFQQGKPSNFREQRRTCRSNHFSCDHVPKRNRPPADCFKAKRRQSTRRNTIGGSYSDAPDNENGGGSENAEQVSESIQHPCRAATKKRVRPSCMLLEKLVWSSVSACVCQIEKCGCDNTYCIVHTSVCTQHKMYKFTLLCRDFCNL